MNKEGSLEQGEGVSGRPGVIDEVAQNGGVVRGDGVEQVDGAGVEGLGDLGEGFVRAHVVVGVPVLVGVAPEKGLVAQLLGLASAGKREKLKRMENIL